VLRGARGSSQTWRSSSAVRSSLAGHKLRGIAGRSKQRYRVCKWWRSVLASNISSKRTCEKAARRLTPALERMKQTSAANLAFLLVATGWVLAFYGVMSQLGDPSPSVPREQIEAARHLSLVILCVGVMCVLAALWLTGYSFSGARIRASICAALIVLPSVAVILSLL
jgi:hypothetical protein